MVSKGHHFNAPLDNVLLEWLLLGKVKLKALRKLDWQQQAANRAYEEHCQQTFYPGHCDMSDALSIDFYVKRLRLNKFDEFLIMRRIEGYTFRELAKTLKTSRQAVHEAYCLARKRALKRMDSLERIASLVDRVQDWSRY